MTCQNYTMKHSHASRQAWIDQSDGNRITLGSWNALRCWIMDEAMHNGKEHIHECSIEDDTADEHQQENRCHCCQRNPPLHWTEYDSSNFWLPLWVFILLQEEHPNSSSDDDAHQRRGLHDDRQDQLNDEEDCIICLKIVEVGCDARASLIGAWHGEWPQELTPRLGLRQEAASLVFDGT
mmetsp:Transcript_81019/g.142851  ORF Transcript_81019/g.142851 Transcript_81019/m.142851 type:complete len:180 (+) Transcript_81019:72-611(+)